MSDRRCVVGPSARARGLLCALTLCGLGTTPLAAQRTDSARVGARTAPPARARPDTLRPPISPRRAFFLSLLLPGYAQSILERPIAGAIFVGIEATSIAMAAKSANDLHYAKVHAADSVIVRFEIDPATGQPVIDPTTNKPRVAEYARNRYAGERVNARRTHLEDWIALLVANHLIAGAEAFASAQLWDLPARVELRALPCGAVIGASVRW